MRAVAEEQLSVFLKNRPGVVAELCTALMDREVNIRALTVLETIDVGTLRMVVDNAPLAKEVCRDVGAAYVEVPVVALCLPNNAGAFGKAAQYFGEFGINIEYVYVTASSTSDQSLAIFRVSDQQRALEIEFKFE